MMMEVTEIMMMTIITTTAIMRKMGYYDSKIIKKKKKSNNIFKTKNDFVVIAKVFTSGKILIVESVVSFCEYLLAVIDKVIQTLFL
jgi:hypothetical protein